MHRALFLILLLALLLNDVSCWRRRRRRRYVPPPVHGGWSSWTFSGPCSNTCGGGTQQRTRSCTNPRPANGGSQCPGGSTSHISCNNNACPIKVNGGWGSWSKFGACSQSCGVGHRIRYRQCTHPEPANGGEPCFGLSSENMICNSHKCPDEPNSETIVTQSMLGAIRFQLVGCFTNNHHRLQQLLITERDHTSHAWNGEWIDWNNWDNYMEAFINRCAVETKRKKFKVFGMSYFGECWSDTGVLDALAVYTNNLKDSSRCVTEGYKDCKVGDTRCIGKHFGIAVYQIIEP